MNRNAALKALVIGQAILIVGLLIYRFQREDSDGVSPQQEANIDETQSVGSTPKITLGDALKVARDGLARMRDELKDYSGTMAKRESIEGSVKRSVMLIKVQCRQKVDEELKRPMRVYLNFVEPSDIAGREVIWAEDQREGNLIAHDAGIKNLAYVELEPTSKMAMEDNRYPITEIGMVNLVAQLIDRGEQLSEENVAAEIFDDARVGEQQCQKIRLELSQPHEKLDFRIAEIYFDQQRGIPLRYAAWGWQGEGDDALLEEYVYSELELNIGLSDEDFDPGNDEYNFPLLKLPF